MMNNYLFLGFSIPDSVMKDIFKEDKYPSIQNHKFNWNLIKAIESNLKDGEIKYISFRAVSDYPYYKKKIIKKNEWELKLFDKNIKILEVPHINIGVLKIITRFILGLYYSINRFWKVENKKAVLAYSVHIPIMLIGYIISRMYKIDFITIWTDPPSVAHSRESGLKSKLRNIELKLSKFLMKKSDKVIALTEYLANDFAPKKEKLIIEGILDIAEKKTEKVENDKFKIVYTGSLEKKYGIGNIVDAVIEIKNENIIFEIYGKGDYEKELIEISKKYKKIKYKGFLQNDLILEIQRKADLLINARSALDEYVKYSFPSKTLEYMVSGTPVMTTFLPGMPEEYKEKLIILENNDKETITKKIKEIYFLSKEERNKMGETSKEFALSKNYVVQGEKIVKFI